MPELPEVESLRRSLEPFLLDTKLTDARLLRDDMCTVVTRDPSSSNTRISPRDLLDQATITSLERRGKQLAIVAADGRTLIVQLGMSGQVLIVDDPSHALLHTHVHAMWTLSRGGLMLFRDPRRFGGLSTLHHHEHLRSIAWRDLGPDALTITGETLAMRSAASARAVKAVLLDQRVLAGVGNIYADESLFRARINPATPARAVSPVQWDSLAEAVRTVLQAAVAAGGRSLRDYVDAQGQAGEATQGHQVYGRGHEPCTACGTPLRQAQLHQRTTVWCAACQPRRRVRRSTRR